MELYIHAFIMSTWQSVWKFIYWFILTIGINSVASLGIKQSMRKRLAFQFYASDQILERGSMTDNIYHSPCCCLMRRTFQIPVGLPKSTTRKELYSTLVKLRVYMLPSIALGAGFPPYFELCQHVWCSAILPGGASEINPVFPECVSICMIL